MRGRLWQQNSYCSLAYSALACFRMGMSGSASFQIVMSKSGHKRK